MAATTTNSDGKVAVPPKPYSLMFHPYITWVDVIITFLMSFFLPVMKMLVYAPTSRSADALKSAKDMRTKVSNLVKTPLKQKVEEWSKSAKSPIVEYVGTLPIQGDVLKKWGIVKDDDIELTSCCSPNKEVEILVRFPSSILSPTDDKIQTSGETESGCAKVDALDDLASLAPDVPLMVHFHGGGFTMGSVRMDIVVQEAVDLAKITKEQDGSSDESAAKPIIFVCVAYSQAPDRPFPMAIIEALSVVDYFLTSSSSRKIHIDGISAGGNLALVAALETHRRYPGRVVSVRAQAPMLCPSADSMSYYMNSRSSWFVPTGWLRWSWQSYLSMEHSPLPANKDGEDVPNLEDTTTMEQVLKRDSNDTLWSNSKWNQNPSTRRLIEPMTDVPNKGPSSWQEDSTKFLIVVNKADPLCDDGLAMAKALEEAGASVKLFEHTGTHIVGSMLDKEGNEKGNKAWAEAVFG